MAKSNDYTARASSMADKIWVRNEDDWMGITDPTLRRRIQNRYNQRMLRSRKRKGKEPSSKPALRQDNTGLVPALPQAQQGLADLDVRAIAAAMRSVHILDPGSKQSQLIMREFEALARSYHAARIPALTLRPLLSQYSFIRALWANVEVLGLSAAQMADDDAPSPFNAADSAPGANAPRLPAGLRPTALQRATLHHPWLDLLPFPQLRDNLFRRGFECFDEEELCHDMRGRVHQDPGVLVWLDPWDARGWEVTEAFVRSWGWAVVGCYDLFRSTNEWRARRGERALFKLPGR